MIILMLLIGYCTLKISVVAYLLKHYKVIVEGLVLSKRNPGEWHKITEVLEGVGWGDKEQSSLHFLSCASLFAITQGQLLMSITKV